MARILIPGDLDTHPTSHPRFSTNPELVQIGNFTVFLFNYLSHAFIIIAIIIYLFN